MSYNEFPSPQVHEQQSALSFPEPVHLPTNTNEAPTLEQPHGYTQPLLGTSYAPPPNETGQNGVVNQQFNHPPGTSGRQNGWMDDGNDQVSALNSEQPRDQQGTYHQTNGTLHRLQSSVSSTRDYGHVNDITYNPDYDTTNIAAYPGNAGNAAEVGPLLHGLTHVGSNRYPTQWNSAGQGMSQGQLPSESVGGGVGVGTHNPPQMNMPSACIPPTSPLEQDGFMVHLGGDTAGRHEIGFIAPEALRNHSFPILSTTNGDSHPAVSPMQMPVGKATQAELVSQPVPGFSDGSHTHQNGGGGPPEILNVATQSTAGNLMPVPHLPDSRYDTNSDEEEDSLVDPYAQVESKETGQPRDDGHEHKTKDVPVGENESKRPPDGTRAIPGNMDGNSHPVPKRTGGGNTGGNTGGRSNGSGGGNHGTSGEGNQSAIGGGDSHAGGCCSGCIIA